MDIEVYNSRLARARSLMHPHGLDYLLVGPSADLYYLVGAQHRTSERLALLLLPQEGPGHMVVPFFEAPSLPPLPRDVQVATWDEDQNPARLVANLISSATGTHPGGAHVTIGVSDRVWALFLLQVQAELPRAAFTRASGVLSSLRQIKVPEEVDLLRRSGAIADQVFDEIVRGRFTGRSEQDVGQEIAALLKAGGLQVEGSPIVASGPNSASPHHHTGDRVIERGDVVVLDFGGTLQGYYSDITRTVFVGREPDPDPERGVVYNLVAAAQEKAFRAARPGMSCESLDAVARDFLTEAGFGQYFIHRLGHGIGLDGHEPPYLVKGNSAVLQPGMAFSIEPGLYLPGNFGVRVEDCVALHEQGAERLNNASRDITVVQ
jgi:Xaa-Pro aminopeptidase